MTDGSPLANTFRKKKVTRINTIMERYTNNYSTILEKKERIDEEESETSLDMNEEESETSLDMSNSLFGFMINEKEVAAVPEREDDLDSSKTQKFFSKNKTKHNTKYDSDLESNNSHLVAKIATNNSNKTGKDRKNMKMVTISDMELQQIDLNSPMLNLNTYHKNKN
eukprot:CAMPEP_0116991534 /NCGR_PEP_ID=MMETSP0467-20121206/66196_1 /TAXON_ID=283647 /ORGANISM="Mesodinium pulex, Strain SPMC105" /LENGTH=166 /DNA_ID=CAMNT_0004688637 /DNA_START=102 /DNA_END=603 /DNA_ORIENTATION=-